MKSCKDGGTLLFVVRYLELACEQPAAMKERGKEKRDP